MLFGDGISLAFWLNGTDSQNCCAFRGGPFTESRYFGEGVGIAVKRGNEYAAAGVQLGAVPAVGKGALQRSVAALFPDQPVLASLRTIQVPFRNAGDLRIQAVQVRRRPLTLPEVAHAGNRHDSPSQRSRFLARLCARVHLHQSHPRHLLRRFTHASYSISDSADLFVFLAGWALRYVVGAARAAAADLATWCCASAAARSRFMPRRS